MKIAVMLLLALACLLSLYALKFDFATGFGCLAGAMLLSEIRSALRKGFRS